MNQGIFRLVFDPRRGMRVPAAEGVRCRGKQTARGAGRSAAGLVVALSAVVAQAAPPLPAILNRGATPTLPVAAPNFNKVGRASQFIDPANGRRLVVQQADKKVVLNWSSFDIGSGYAVRFDQPDGGSALNRIGSASPSVILGNLEANGEVILYNANGVLFGRGATVNTGNFVATTLNIADSLFETGYRGITTGAAAFAAQDAEIDGFIRVEAGANIKVAEGGSLMLFAPRVLNEGTLAAPGGQVALAAGQKVYLTSSRNAAERGLLVEVDPFATSDTDYNMVENAARTERVVQDGRLVDKVNEIVAERGSATLVGLAVRQMGIARATTAVQGQNGAIYLMAHGKTTATQLEGGRSGEFQRAADEMGTLVLGPGSVTRVDPDASGRTQTDAAPFYNSIVRLEGKNIHLQGGASIVAPGAGGVTPKDANNAENKRGVSILASSAPRNSPLFMTGLTSGVPDDSRVVIDPGVRIDVSGVDLATPLPMSRNVLTGRLFSIELADSPVQRNGVLYRQPISFDARRGTPVADVSGFYNSIERSAEEQLTHGGSIAIEADGAVVVGQGARLDVSGGSVKYAGGEIKTTLLRRGNRIIDVADARPDVIYDEVITPERGRYEPGYVEGKDAGTLTVAGRQVVLDAELAGGVTAGIHQRAPASRPLGGTLQVGIAGLGTTIADFYVDTITLSETGGAPLASSFFRDPFGSSLGARGDSAMLSAQAIEAGGFSRLNLLTNGLLLVNAGTSLDLGVGGSFSASAGRIEAAGALRAPSGAMKLEAVNTVTTTDSGISVLLKSGAVLDVAGLWTNDGLARERQTVAPIALGGGEISVSAFHSVEVQEGSALNVSAGAWRNSAGKLSKGKAGSITLATNVSNDPYVPVEWGTLKLGGRLSGFGFSGGGSLSLTVPELSVAYAGDNGFRLAPDFFSANGFKSISVRSSDDVVFADDVQLAATLRNWQFTPGAMTQASGAMDERVVSVETLPSHSRDAVNLSFAATRMPAPSLGYDGANLIVGERALLATEAGGKLSLSAAESMIVAGTLSAPGGSINLSITGTRGGTDDAPDNIGLLPAQALWLTDTARILAAGTAKVRTDARGMRTGTVFGGGSVSLDARRGYLVAEAGSVVDVSGFETMLNPYGWAALSLVSRGAGSIALGGAEGIFFDAQMLAHGPSGRSEGGSLTVSMSRRGLDSATSGAVQPYPDAERQIVVRADKGGLPDTVTPGVDLDALLGNGTAEVSAAQIAGAGFASVALRADDRIRFAESVQMNLPRSLELNSRVIEGAPGAQVALRAPYVALGDQDITDVSGSTKASAARGTATLAVTADLVDLVGRLGLQGFSNTQLSATLGGRRDGEIRLRGRNQPNSTVLDGALLFAGDLTLTAGQIYPTTLSSYEISGLAGDSVLRTRHPDGGSSAQAPLSALGSLTLAADVIEHGGVMRAPFGELALSADRLTLLDGSELSTAGAGLTVPVGTTINGRSWFYYPTGQKEGTPAGEVLAITEMPVGKQVSLNARELSVAPSAKVSAAGGGDIQASEFVAGVGGSHDYLASRTDLYAVLPGYGFPYAPYDTQAQLGTNLRPGDQIVITMAGSGLPPGRYTLLPVSYALLPGAFLVSLAPDQGRGPLKAPLRNTDKSVVVTGYRSSAGSSVQGDDHVRYLVEPTGTFTAKSEYRLTSGNEFFSTQATRLGAEVGALPADAGRVSIVANQLMDWKALFDLSAPSGAKAGEFDLAVPNVLVTVEGAGAPEGYTAVSAESLAQTGAASVLLGGTRSGSGSSVTARTVSENVRVAGTSEPIRVNELMLAATHKVEIAEGVAIIADGNAAARKGELKLDGDGAFVRVSDKPGLDLVRTGVSRARGDIMVARGARLEGAEVQLDASGHVALDNQAVIAARSFNLGTGRIALGGPSPEGDAVVLSGSLLDTVLAAERLTLRSYSTIDFLRSLALGSVDATGNASLDFLMLDAQGLRGLGAASDEVRIVAGDIVLRNSTGISATASGQGSLSIEARPPLRFGETGGLEIAAGAQSLGFGSSRLASTGDIVFSGTGSVASQGAVTLDAARVTTTTGANQSVTSAGLLTVSRNEAGHTLGEQVGVGASLALSGQRAIQDGTIELPGGKLAITGQAGAGGAAAVELTARSQTLAGGFASTASDGWTVYGDGGTVSLNAVQGAIRVDGLVNVAALAGGGNGGRLDIAATGSGGALALGSGVSLQGAGGAGGSGGSLKMDLRTLAGGGAGNLDGIVQQTVAGSFDKAVDLRVREGDVALASGGIKAESVAIAADAGSLTVNGTISADAEQGGVVQLAAERDVVLGANGRISARSSRAGANGGDVLLSSDSGLVRLQAGSTIDAGGDDNKDGRVVLRAARTTNSVKVAPVAGSITAGEIDIEAVKTYTGYTSLGSGTTAGAKLGQTTVMNEITSFMASKNAILSGLGVTSGPRFHLRAGVEVDASGDFNIANDWNLYSASRPGGEPGFLTVRAAGNLNVNGTLSDGFNGVARNSTIQDGAAWSFRLAGGADLGAANPLAVKPNDSSGDLAIAGGKLLRTTSGSIELAVGRDILLKGDKDNPATVMVTGTRVAALADFKAPANAVFTSRGGRVSATAARDISSPPSDQLINNWFFHSGRLNPITGQFLSDLAWWSRFDLFRHGFGSFGGGNVTLAAGRDMLNASAFAPTSARMAADAPDASTLVIDNGGNVEVTAGRNIAGGAYFVGRGEGLLAAGGALLKGSSPAATVSAMAPMLALMDGGWRARARNDIELGGIFNPTMFASASSIANSTAASYFTYAPTAGLDAATTAGNFVWSEPAAVSNSLTALAALPTGATADISYLTAIDPYVLSVAPPTVKVSAYAGDIDLAVDRFGLSLYPSAIGNLGLHAGGDINILGSVRVMDNLPDDLASITNPVINSQRGVSVQLVKQTQTSIPTKIDFTGLHANDSEPLRIHADGDIVVADGQRIISPKAASITAGGDIVTLTYIGQHHDADDETLVSAGGNILGTTVVRQNGGLLMLAGPGELKLEAGRQVDLGVSTGIETVGNLYNPSLPNGGASISVGAGLKATLTDKGWDGFVTDYLATTGSPVGVDRRAELVAYVKAALKLPAARAVSYDEARSLLEAAPGSARVAFVAQVLADEFARTYLAPGKAYAAGWTQTAAAAGVSPEVFAGAAFNAYRNQVVYAELWRSGIAGSTAETQAAKDAAFADGYKVLEKAGYGAPFSFFGDIDLVESKVQTKRGGDIGFRAPGGAINVGLSSEASSSASTRSGADRGVVAFSGGNIRAFSDGDFQVNAQKVFVMGTGNIALWSSNGNIDSGRGANTTVTVPPMVPRITDDGVVFELPSLATGSGIGILALASGEAAGQIGLFAPRGELIALDALIRAPGPIFVGAQTVRGADNIVGGSVVGAPVAPVSAPVAAVSTTNSTTEAAAASSMAGSDSGRAQREVNSLLTVDVVGLGDNDVNCEAGGEGCGAKDDKTR